MKLFPILILLSTVLLINGCKTQIPPTDFGFVLEFWWQEKVSSLDSSYTRGYSGRNKTVKIIFSDAEKKEIYNELISIDFDSYPEDYKPECSGGLIPAPFYGLTVRQNNKTKSVKWLNSCGGSYDRKTKEYLKIVQRIIDMTMSRKEVKDLPETDIIII